MQIFLINAREGFYIMMNIVLHEPEIPHNAGAVGRTCHAAGAVLHLIRPLGFDTGDRALKRAGLDYWKDLDIRYYDDLNHFYNKNAGISDRIYYATTKAGRSYADVEYAADSFIVFGTESAGLPEELLAENFDRCVRIPMLPGTRSLNLSVSVGIILFEALRQNGFPGLSGEGQLHRLSWK